ncbi:zinc finger protein 239-like isoform X2 [Schistocerca gregaria]|uniref:zinc finger protein 239-like isoform X2 n=1 Tax=Schistocerca gregaria TaxID=7010 RepID=UPI00211E46C6|nr:zinc finger protein 239-like isoform X2 [Schistocerca gregaria]XP_049843816.1 zinc finger protein 239-like isoform X2 [Schistocerca gregaria]
MFNADLNDHSAKGIMGYVKQEHTDTGILTVKKEFGLEFEELEFEDYRPEISTRQNDKDSAQIIIKEETEFGDKVIELLGLPNVSADTNGAKVSTFQNDHESAQIIIKEEIDCDIDNGSVNDLDSPHFADEVPGPTLRRSSRRRCQRFSLDDLSESPTDESPVCKFRKKVRVRNSSHDGRRRKSDRGTVCGKSFELYCDICGRGFTRIGYLRRHVATHSESKRYCCGQCGKCFGRSDNLREHERLHGGESYGCDVCGSVFSQPRQLQRHALLHAGERRFRCDVCGRAFRVRGYLRDHLRVHTGERPFACHVCGKSFTQAAHRRVHARLHTGERRHGCEVCGKLFYRRTHLKLHARVHTGFRQRRRKARR